jgi:hypothetical protein
MWMLILIAVHVNDPKDIPGRVTMEFPSQAACLQALSSMDYWLKFSSFRMEGRCEPRKS